MDTARYLAALLILITLPPGILLWFFIHPFASFWRKFGPTWTYLILGFPMLGLMVGIFLARKTLLSMDFGAHYLLSLLALLCFAGAAVIGFKRKRLLTFGILAGLPELSQKRYPGKLLTQGIYAKVRHPRYVEVFLAVLAYALFANYLGPYVAVALSVPTIGWTVFLEERELRERFGSEYEEYCREVPRFIPRLSR